MPKMKSHSGTKKRVKVTGSGKLMHRQANLGHLNAHKSSKRLRRLKGNTEMAGSDLKQAKALLAGHPGRRHRSRRHRPVCALVQPNYGADS